MGGRLIEFCAGGAAVSLRWLRSDAAPPVGWRGGKAAYADRILQALGLRPGGGRAGQLVLVEPGPYGELWEMLAHDQAGYTRRIVAQLDEWHGAFCDVPEVLHRQLARAEVPDDLVLRAATWLVLQHWSWGGKPVYARGRVWQSHGFSGVVAGRDWHNLRDALEALPPLLGASVACCTAERARMWGSRGDLAVIDPPYQGTSQAFSHELPRAEVLELALGLAGRGAVVAVCEAEPLPLEGWHHLELGRPRGRGRTASAQQSEWLTLNRPPLGQMALVGGGA